MNSRNRNTGLAHSFVICTLNRPADLREAIESLFRQSLLPFELVVVDASDNNATENLAREMAGSSPFPVNYMHTRPGLTYQRNRGIEAANGDIIHFIDDDVILEPNYLEVLDATFTDPRNSHVAGAGGTITNIPRLPWFAVLLKRAFMFNHNYGSGRLQPSGYAAFGYNSNLRSPIRVNILCGCCAYIGEILKKYRFDENLPGYALQEDVDLSYRISRKHELLFVPTARLLHKQSPIARTKPAAYFFRYLYNHYYISMKNLPRTLDHIAAFWYSHAAATLGILGIAVLKRSTQPLLGVLKAHLTIAKDIFKNVFG
jgi:glycosyltransferase involved in cell wall biosynthesis